MSHIFFRPADGFVGDVIPFYWQGQYHAFYLKAPLPPKRKGANGTPYAHAVSRDLAHWEEWPLVIEPGEPGAPDDLSCFTGSVIERNGVFNLFYTGYQGEGKPQTICRATSHDLRAWEKDPHNPLMFADPRWYEPNDWRDPFPFWNEAAGEYWMILAARETRGPSNRRGCIALMTSPDLEHWETRPPFWSPGLYYTHECPDLFRIGDWWYLVYSTFSERNITHYRMSRSLAGPWYAPTNDSFDGRAFYAAKTAGDGQRRFVFGWDPTRDGETDHGRWDWGGHMVVHEIRALADGALTVHTPATVDDRFGHTQPLALTPYLGHWQPGQNALIATRTDGFAASFVAEEPDRYMIECTVTCPSETRSCGLVLHADDKLETYYQVRWEPGSLRVVFDRWPRPGDEPFMLERPLTEPTQQVPLKLKVFVDGTVVVVYINDSLALSCRMYDHPAGQVGVFVAEGEAAFTDIVVRSP